ncbi:MAG: hypothetical protein ACPGRE_06085 [Flavobacteriaceae bacterium]
MSPYKLSHLPKTLKKLIALFLFVISIGFYNSISFVNHTSGSIQGIQEQYQGNEEQEDVEVFKYKKSKSQIMTTVHSHMISLGMLFFVIALIVYGTSLPAAWKSFLMFEPLFSVLFTFSGIYFLWLGYDWFKWIIAISGTLMTLSYSFSIIFIFRDLFFKE